MEFPGSLHNHTDYSNLRLRDAITTYDKLIDYAIELGHEVIAFTDHEALCNVVKIEEYYEKIKKVHPNFKVIYGNEIYLCRNGLNKDNFDPQKDNYYHFILLAKNAEGHKQLRQLSTRAWKRSYEDRGLIRVPTYYQDLIDIIGANKGNVIASSACLGSFLDKKLLEYNVSKDARLYENIKNWCLKIENIFGKGNFYLELQPSATQEQTIVNELLYQLSQDIGLPYIITTDTHYLKKELAPIHKAFLNSQDKEREVDEFYATTYLMNTEELETQLSFDKEMYDKAYQNILNIKAQCEDYSFKKPLKIPQLKWIIPETTDIEDFYVAQIPNLKLFIDSDFEGDNILARAIVDKIKKEPTLQNRETYDELNDNLDTVWKSSEVNKVHWSSYFLNLQNNIKQCWEAGTLVGPARGSGGGFLLLYVLDIIQMNKMREKTELFAWRFLNPDRVSVLDIDTDIEGSKRAQVLQHFRNYYGADRVANVITFGTESTKSALLTACKGVGIDNDRAQYLSSLIPSDRGQIRSLKQCYYGDVDKGFKPVATFKKEMNSPEFKEVWRVAQEIEGLICRMGEHAGGVIFVDEPFEETTALLRVPNGDIVTQLDLHDAEKTSLIKIDLLSVEALDKMHACLDLLIKGGEITPESTLKETYEKYLGLYNIERTDPEMWKMVWDHKIQSLFQMEQASGIQGIDIAKPASVEDLAVLNSVIRLMPESPGQETPLEKWARLRQDINLWYKEMERYGLTKEEINWLAHHSAFTQGICESQEGMMSLVQEPQLGGHSLKFADTCRKAIAKKVGSLFEECEKEFYKTIEEKGLSQKLAHYVWDVALRVQRGYSFNRLLWPVRAFPFISGVIIL